MYTHPLLSIALVYFLAPQNSLFAQAQQCYFPDGSLASNYNACNSTNPIGSVCCNLVNSACSMDGFCYGSAGYLYRGGCTDQLWKSPNCAKHCVDSATHIFSNIIPCPDMGGVFTTSFCCSDVPGSSAANQSCYEQKFKMPSGFGNFFMPSTNTGQQVQPGSNSTSSPAHAESSSTASSSSVTPSSSSVTSSSSTITGTPGTSPSTAAHAQPANHAMQIGVATWVPLGLLLLSALGILLIRERRGRIREEQLMQNAKMVGMDEVDVETHDPFPRIDAERQELEEIHLRELQSSEVHEVF